MTSLADLMDDPLSMILASHYRARAVCHAWCAVVDEWVREHGIRLYCTATRHVDNADFVLTKDQLTGRQFPVVLTVRPDKAFPLSNCVRIDVRIGDESIDRAILRPGAPRQASFLVAPPHSRKRERGGPRVRRSDDFTAFDLRSSRVKITATDEVSPTSTRMLPHMILERYGVGVRIIVVDHHRSTNRMEGRYFKVATECDVGARDAIETEVAWKAFGARLRRALEIVHRTVHSSSP